MWHFPEAPVGSSSLSVTMSSMATFLTWANRQVDVIKLNWLDSQFNQRLSECKAATLSGILFGGTGMHMWVGEWERGNSLTSPLS